MELYAINSGNFTLDGGAMFGVVPKTLWSKRIQPDPQNQCTWAMRCLLIKDGNNNILIDSGIGNKQDAKFLGHYNVKEVASWDSLLEPYGLSSTDITHHILTHLHFDHCGGSLYRNEANEIKRTFPNAVYHISKAQIETALMPNAREKASFLIENIENLSVGGEIILHEFEQEILPNISVQFYDGHTDGMMIPFIKFNNKIIVYMADLLPSKHHISIPWVMAYDIRPLVTLEEKQDFLTIAANNGYYLFLEHDADTECISLQHSEKGIVLEKEYTLQEVINL